MDFGGFKRIQRELKITKGKSGFLEIHQDIPGQSIMHYLEHIMMHWNASGHIMMHQNASGDIIMHQTTSRHIMMYQYASGVIRIHGDSENKSYTALCTIHLIFLMIFGDSGK